MTNDLILVGRIVKFETIKDNKKTTVVIAVNRSFKNADGIYETDFIPCVLLNEISERTQEYCEKGDLIGIRGRIEAVDEKVQIIADKVTFLSSKREDFENDN